MPRRSLSAAALFLSACAVAAPAAAGTFGLHLGSVHFPSRDFNNANPGVFWRADNGLTAGAYRNSLRRSSVYAGYTWAWGRAGLTAGGVTGYADNVQPLLVPSFVFLRTEAVSLRVAFIPRIEKRIESHVLHLMAEF